MEKKFFNPENEICDSINADSYCIIEKNQNNTTKSIISYFNINGTKYSQGEYDFIKVWKKNGYINYYDSLGRITSKYTYVYNNLNGPFYQYFENGVINIKGTYFSNNYTDSLFTFYKSGSPRRIDLYKSGSFVSGKCYTSEGKDTLHFPFEKVAEYPGGFVAMSQFIVKNLIYPSVAIEANLQGKCYLKFKIDETGNINDVTIVKGVPGCPECDKEASRVIQSMGKWNPGEIDGYLVDHWFQTPINFKLEDDFETKKEKKRNHKKG